MEFFRQENLSELPFPPPEDLSNPGIKPGSPALHTDSLPLSCVEGINHFNVPQITGIEFTWSLGFSQHLLKWGKIHSFNFPPSESEKKSWIIGYLHFLEWCSFYNFENYRSWWKSGLMDYWQANGSHESFQHRLHDNSYWFHGARLVWKKLVKSLAARVQKDLESCKLSTAGWDWRLIEAFCEHIWQEVTSVATAGCKEAEDGVGPGSVMNSALYSFPEFSEASPVTATEGIIGWGAVTVVFCMAKCLVCPCLSFSGKWNECAFFFSFFHI